MLEHGRKVIGQLGAEAGGRTCVSANNLERAEVEDLSGHDIPPRMQLAEQGREASEELRPSEVEGRQGSPLDETGDHETFLMMHDLGREPRGGGDLVAGHFIAAIDAQERTRFG